MSAPPPVVAPPVSPGEEKTAVVTVALRTYERAAVEAAIRRLLEPLGGMAAFVRPGQRVLLKPNMLAGKSPEKAVTTHPEVVRAVIVLAQEAGGIVAVGDSPGVGSPRQVAERCGILAVIEETGATFAPFAESRLVALGSAAFQRLELAVDILDADVVINLPKLKTHQMMGMTCAVKNLFGAVIGWRKPRLHLEAGEDKALFARLLLDLAARIRPALTIVDAVVAMEGDGPGSGEPIELGALLAGTESLAVDLAAAEISGIPFRSIWTLTEARRLNTPFCRPEEVAFLGILPQELRPAAFRPAKSTEIHFGLPRLLQRPLRRALSARPVPDHARCIRCGLCVKSCPPQAMAIRNDRLHIDQKLCILCFCCHELCPYGALKTRQGWLLRLAGGLRR